MVAQTKSCTKQTLKISSFAHEYFFCNISTHQNDGAQIRLPEKLKVFWVVRHVLEVIARLPPLRATFFSRSSCGWAGVSLNVAEILIFNCQVSDRGMKNYTSIYIKSLLTSIFISIFLIFWKNPPFYSIMPNKRIIIVAVSALVAVPLGFRVVSESPFIRPLPTA